MKTLIGILVSFIALCPATSEERDRVPLFRDTDGSEDRLSHVSVSFKEKSILIGIETPTTATPFWITSPHKRPPFKYFRSGLPSLILVRNLDKPNEFRLVIQPKNLSRIIQPRTFKKNFTLPLNMGGKEVGEVTLYTKEGEINPHKATFKIDRDSCREVGEDFTVLTGEVPGRGIINESLTE